MERDYTKGPVLRSMLLFALTMIAGNLLQQCYNIADTLIVGRLLGSNALAAVGSSFSLMTFMTSVLLGLCMGSSVLFSMYYGRKDQKGLGESLFASFVLISAVTLFLNLLSIFLLDSIRTLLSVPGEVWTYMRQYLRIVFLGITATFFYNYSASFLRAIGNSVIPLVFLAAAAVLNILLDLLFVVVLKRGVSGAAEATVIAQYFSGIGITLHAFFRTPQFKALKGCFHFQRSCLKTVAAFSFLTCLQQSVMNFGILMVQGVVNTFGPAVMAAFAAGVKIDAFAYMPVQDFGNAFSTFIAQNYGSGSKKRIREGFRTALCVSTLFSMAVSVLVFLFAPDLMRLFIKASESGIIAEGVRYLRIEGFFYCGIGCLFLLYGLYRALGKPGMSVVLTVISLGSRVLLAYLLPSVPLFGVTGIWWAVPIGWLLADLTGILYYCSRKEKLLS